MPPVSHSDTPQPPSGCFLTPIRNRLYDCCKASAGVRDDVRTFHVAKVLHRRCGSRILRWKFFHFSVSSFKIQVSSFAVILVIWSFGQNRFRDVKIRHYNKYFIFIYSEQMTESENENDHFDLDQMTTIWRACSRSAKLMQAWLCPRS